MKIDTKKYQIIMEPQAHKRIKRRANQLKIPIGGMIQNLLASFEFRVKQVYSEIEKDGRIDSIYLDNTIIRLLLKKDKGEISEEKFRLEVARAVKALHTDDWKPDIILGNDDDTLSSE